MRNPVKKNMGMSLVEVLMALAIMGIGLVGLVASASRCLAVVRKAKNYENARHLLGRVEFKLQEHLLEEADDELQDDSESWGFKSPYQDYTGSWELKKIGSDDDETKGLFEVTMRVGWSERGFDAFESVTTYLYAPERVLTGSVTTQR